MCSTPRIETDSASARDAEVKMLYGLGKRVVSASASLNLQISPCPYSIWPCKRLPQSDFVIDNFQGNDNLIASLHIEMSPECTNSRAGAIIFENGQRAQGIAFLSIDSSASLLD